MNKKLHVENLAKSETEIQLKDLFTTAGEVKYVKINLDPQTKLSNGTATVEMANENETNNAVAELNGKDVSGQKIRVTVIA